MKRSRHIWKAFALCLSLLAAAMGWISVKALRSHQAEVEARREAALEQDVRLALYRMDNALTALVTRESAWPHFAYGAFLPVDRALGAMPGDLGGPERLAVSPLVRAASPDVLVHFQFEPDGRLTSPRVPGAQQRGLLVPEHLSAEEVARAEARLEELAAIVDRDRLVAMLPSPTAEPSALVLVPGFEPAPQLSADSRRGMREAPSRRRNFEEYSFRSQAVQQGVSNSLLVQNAGVNWMANADVPLTDVGGVVMTPLWIAGRLILARRVSLGGRQYVQGCLLDWPAIESRLLASIDDLLPAADLRPVASAPDAGESGMLAALPVRLIPGERRGASSISSETGDFAASIGFSLLVAWACVVLAAGAVALLVHGVIRLSERRAAFVSAVTHELRTPLTTFHMYTEMLDEGMVPDEARAHYLKTLRCEASRLSHLVENVLAYARLERGRADGRVETLRLDRLLEPIEARLANHARRDDMELIVEADEAAFSATVRANPSAVEQILLNLVDNAGKYAAGASDKRIHLAARQVDGQVALRVRDHGPGISAPASRHLFRSFTKSAHEAAHSAPGIGLGLALSRRLARDMGARLELDRTVDGGACFVLTLPMASGATAP